MKYPKIIILAQGGTHGDFLYSCGLLMLENRPTIINETGRALGRSNFLQDNMYNFEGGVYRKKNYVFDTDIEVCHVWHEEFLKFNSKFYYISFKDEHIPVIKKMFLAKVCKNNIDTAIESRKKFLPPAVANKINKKNFDRYWTSSLKTGVKSYRKQPDVNKIDMIDLYNFEKLCSIMTHMGIFNENKTNKLKSMHQSWVEKNSEYITEILQ